MNKIRCPHGISPKGNCDVCLKKYREKYIKRYHQSIEYKEYQKEYRQTPKHKEYIKKYMRLYNSKAFNPSPAKPEHAKSDHVCRNQVGTLDSSVSETGGGFIRASPFVCKGIKRDKNG